MSNTLIIRPIKPEDFPEWMTLWEGYNLFYGRSQLPTEITQMTWSRFFDPTEPVHALVAEKNKKLLGLAHYLYHRSTIQIELSCYLQDLFTSETARNQGIGQKLIEAVYEQARIAASPRVYWLTKEDNLIARNLYDKIAKRSGFISYYKKI